MSLRDRLPDAGGLLAAVTGEGQVDVEWLAVPGATQYHVHLHQVDGPSGLDRPTQNIPLGPSTSCRFGGVEPGAYEVQVWVKGRHGGMKGLARTLVLVGLPLPEGVDPRYLEP